ncbi:MAG TPA: hypothetical protein VM261_06595 [Kofleriaceae bacterium]|nr:hypothetical protein [Kofleriaceae bacterium]
MTAAEDTLRSWLAELAGMAVVDLSDRNETAVANMMIFALDEAHDTGVDAAALTAFLRDAYRAYSLAAAKAGYEGWFYAWHDEQAGQLRTSAAWIRSAAELPFRAPIAVTDDPATIAAAAIASASVDAISLSDLADLADLSGDGDGGDADLPPEPGRPPLAVFARPMLRAV